MEAMTIDNLYQQRKKLIEQLGENQRAILDFHSKIDIGDTVEIDWNYDYDGRKTWKRPDVRIVKIVDKEYVSPRIFFTGISQIGETLKIIMPDALPAIIEICKSK